MGLVLPRIKGRDALKIYPAMYFRFSKKGGVSIQQKSGQDEKR
jgi:hypothetical protein